jgi:hypothetical protein
MHAGHVSYPLTTAKPTRPRCDNRPCQSRSEGFGERSPKVTSQMKSEARK